MIKSKKKTRMDTNGLVNGSVCICCSFMTRLNKKENNQRYSGDILRGGKPGIMNENNWLRSMLEQPPTGLARRNIPPTELTSSIQNLGLLTRPMVFALPLWPTKPSEPKLAVNLAWNSDRERGGGAEPSVKRRENSVTLPKTRDETTDGKHRS